MAAISTMSLELHPKPLSPVSSSGDPLTSPSNSPAHCATADGMQPHLGLKFEAHRRWDASLPVGFLASVGRVEIKDARAAEGNTLTYVLEVYLSLPASRLPTNKSNVNSKDSQQVAARPTFTVERSFDDFQKLRTSVSSCVSMERQCSCKYCMDFIAYIRFTWSQPRGLVKMLSGTQKRKQILANFINDFVTMGRRRVRKTGKRKCEAQQLVPKLLNEFLLHGAIY